MVKTLLYLDQKNLKVSLELLAAAYEIETKNQTYALCVNFSELELNQIAQGFDYVIQVEDARIQDVDVRNIVSIVAELQQEYDFDIILFPATYHGRSIAPRVAARLETGLTADVTEIGNASLIRPAFDGKIMAGIVNKEEAKPLMATIRPGVFQETARSKKAAHRRQHKVKQVLPCQRELLAMQEKSISLDIRDSKVLVSGGGGIGESFSKLEDLAKVLQGQVSSARKLVDAGIANRKIQVGQSGKTVSPELYLALGIHGALQHVVGLKNVKHMIVVNTDRHAPLCSMADIVVEGDGKTFLEKLLERIATKE